MKVVGVGGGWRAEGAAISLAALPRAGHARTQGIMARGKERGGMEQCMQMTGARREWQQGEMAPGRSASVKTSTLDRARSTPPTDACWPAPAGCSLLTLS